MIGISMRKKGKIIFVDTSAHFALANVRDVDHKAAERFLHELATKRVTMVVTNFIIAETYTLMLRKVGRDRAIEYIESLCEASEVVRVSEDDEKKAWEIILRYKDKDFSYVDATSFAVMERIGMRESFTFDRHFEQYGLNKLP